MAFAGLDHRHHPGVNGNRHHGSADDDVAFTDLLAEFAGHSSAGSQSLSAGGGNGRAAHRTAYLFGVTGRVMPRVKKKHL
ncbi:hypothetical protein [Silvania confinis]|uniref:hypothetical protein n=1 Tax=Silvania confinis TaxID=2926470 RepID=UPI003AF11658